MVRNASRFFFVLVCLFVPIAAKAQCSVICSATVPSTGQTSSSIPFQSRSSACSCSGSPSYAWVFGDGGTSTAQNPSHTYLADGSYNWQLTVTADSTTCTKSGSIVISSGGSVSPAAGTFSGTTSSGRPFSVTVNGSSQITAWSVGHTCFGTGTVSTSGQTCSITNGSFSCGSVFCAPFVGVSSIAGTFDTSTTVSGSAAIRFQPNQFSGCCSQSPTFSASVSPAPLSADGTSDVGGGAAPLDVSFTGSASGGAPPYSYSWSFGDCSPTSTTQNPSHQYLAGNWTAFLTVTDSSFATATDTVDISSVGPAISLITPDSGPTAGGQGVAIDGVNLGSATSVTFGGSPATITGNTSTSINVTTPAHASGTVDVVVTTPGGTDTSTGGYTYNLPPFGPPPGLTATAVGTTQVSVNWSPVAGVNHYEVARSTGAGFSTVASPVGTSYLDNNVSANNSYVYKVRAIDGAATASAYTAPDAATTIVFTDDPLLATTTVVKALHVSMLRTAVNAMRAAAPMAALNFTDPTLSVVSKVHVDELRSALDAARSAIGLPALAYTDPTLIAETSIVKAAHLQEVRDGCK